MRCLALAEAWQDAGGCAIFAMVEASPLLRERLHRASIEAAQICTPSGTDEDAERTIVLARQHTAAWIAVDGYQFDARYQQTLKNAGFKTLFFDDYGHAAHYCSDLVLNQNISAEENLYKNREPYTRLLLGTQYCLLRHEFTSVAHWRREVAAAGHRVLVTMGGSDPENYTETAVAAVRSIEDEIEAVVVIGGSNAHGELFETGNVERNSKIRFHRDVSNMAELMAWADVAISAAGTTCWELCLTGLPSLLIDLADNQTCVARELDRRGCAIHLGSAKDVSAKLLADQLKKLLTSENVRRRMSSLARELVDGKGARRVVAALQGALLHLRPPREDDCHLLWEWANDEQVRAASFSCEPIPWETHAAWFAEKLREDGCRMFVAEDTGGGPVGQVRFDRRPDGDYEIGVSLSSDRRGQGLAAFVIKQAVQTFSASERRVRIHAFVKPENAASLKAFVRSAFMRVGTESIRGQEAVHFTLETDVTPTEIPLSATSSLREDAT
jgi:UDP-2,4-diacetamido-2,4,6-trideoxy-beta-L-altropyranose hydrolase